MSQSSPESRSKQFQTKGYSLGVNPLGLSEEQSAKLYDLINTTGNTLRGCGDDVHKGNQYIAAQVVVVNGKGYVTNDSQYSALRTRAGKSLSSQSEDRSVNEILSRLGEKVVESIIGLSGEGSRKQEVVYTNDVQMFGYPVGQMKPIPMHQDAWDVTPEFLSTQVLETPAGVKIKQELGEVSRDIARSSYRFCENTLKKEAGDVSNRVEQVEVNGSGYIITWIQLRSA